MELLPILQDSHFGNIMCARVYVIMCIHIRDMIVYMYALYIVSIYVPEGTCLHCSN